MRGARWPAEDSRLRAGAGQRGSRGSSGRAMTQPGMLIGTPAYMAPEQINGLPVDARADVFAFGVLLYEYACGAHPFAAATALATVARVLESDARPLPSRADVPEPAGRRSSRAACRRRRPIASDRPANSSARSTSPTRRGRRRAARAWWRVHQIVDRVALHHRARRSAWQIKEWVETPVTRGDFPGARRRGHDRRRPARPPRLHRGDECRAAGDRAPAHPRRDPAARPADRLAVVRRRRDRRRHRARCRRCLRSRWRSASRSRRSCSNRRRRAPHSGTEPMIAIEISVNQASRRYWCRSSGRCRRRPPTKC